MEDADSAAFTFGMWQISSCSLWEFISPGVTAINLFANVQIFLMGLGSSSELFCFFMESR